jgi:hypothetical protein
MKKAGQEQELKEKQGGKLFFKLRVILGEEDDSGEGETFFGPGVIISCAKSKSTARSLPPRVG